jgi:hypothetical protein
MRFRMCSRILFVSSTSPLTHGEYTGVMWCLHALASQNSHTAALLKCELPSIMNASGAMKFLLIVLSASTVVLVVPAVLYLKAPPVL